MNVNILLRRIALVTVWMVLGVVVFSTLSPLNLRPRLGVFVHLERLGAFAVLGFLFAIVYPRRWLAVLVAVMCLAFGLEYMQTMIADRHSRWSDLAVKMAGGVFGVLFAHFLVSRHEHLKQLFLHLKQSRSSSR